MSDAPEVRAEAGEPDDGVRRMPVAEAVCGPDDDPGDEPDEAADTARPMGGLSSTPPGTCPP